MTIRAPRLRRATRHRPRARPADRPARPAGPARPTATAAAPCSPGSAVLGPRRRALQRVRRRVQGRLLRAGLGLQGRPEPAGGQVPRPVRRHGRRRRPRPTSRSRQPRSRATSPRCSPRSPTCRTSRRSTTPTRPRAPSRRTARPWWRTRASTSSTRPTCPSRTASGCSTSPTPRRPAVSQVALGGQSIQQAEQGAIGSEVIGIAAAAIILLLTFGSVVAAGLPILVAIAGLAVSSLFTGLVIAFVDAPDWSTSLATMMGIGIGIDYALLMVTRFREWRAVGLDPEAATDRDPGHRRPLGPRRRQHRRHQHARPVRDGPVLHARCRRRHDPGRPGRDGRQRHAVPGAARLPRPAHRPAAAADRPTPRSPTSRSAATSSPAGRGCAGAG